jgi:hypothetical protein
VFMRLKNLAERVGFEPTLPFRVNTLSKRAPSATRPSLRRIWEELRDALMAGPAGLPFWPFSFYGAKVRWRKLVLLCSQYGPGLTMKGARSTKDTLQKICVAIFAAPCGFESGCDSVPRRCCSYESLGESAEMKGTPGVVEEPAAAEAPTAAPLPPCGAGADSAGLLVGIGGGLIPSTM